MRKQTLVLICRARVFRSCVGRFLRVNEWMWHQLPSFVVKRRPISLYGVFLHSLVKLHSPRTQVHGTFFFRNRPELQMMLTLLKDKPKGATLRISVLACSNGAEVYSILWIIRSARPDLKVVFHAVDISEEILEIARAGRYSPEANDLVNSPIFDRITEKEIQGMFDPDNAKLRIKSWLKEGIRWEIGDAADPKLLEIVGEQDIVVANKFLCHMEPENAEKCLRTLARLVKPGGYLFVSGVDVQVRTKVALDLCWKPVRDLIYEMHNGDPSVRRDWPWRYWGLEPFDKKRQDWKIRYASVFQIGQLQQGTAELSCCSSMQESQ